jgi:3-methyladenine DNA glycosylase AlkD
MKTFIQTLEKEFQQNANPKIAFEQKAYMKNKFEFYGLKSPIRKEISKPFLQKQYLPDKTNAKLIVQGLWEKPEREFQYFAQEFCFKYKNNYKVNDIELFEYMIINKSWWDTVDFIAAKILGNWFMTFPEQRAEISNKWLKSGNIWLQRSAILFQLKYKNETDTDLLSHIINAVTGSKEFFINKAVGWILREYGKTNPNWVLNFTEKTDIAPLSKREALRIILK